MRFLYTNIGRGHPFYLDGIVQSLPSDQSVQIGDVFTESSGLSAAAWMLARWLYARGSSVGDGESLYTRIRRRTDYSRPGVMLNVMGRSLRRRFLDDSAPLVVGHPLLVALLAGKKDLVYQHGELAVPSEALLPGAHTILVPTEFTADRFRERGVPDERLFVSGLCIEPPLVADAPGAFDHRMERLAGSGPLTGAFFSSGAEPHPHVQALIESAVSLALSGGHCLLVARAGGAFAQAAVSAFAGRSMPLFEVPAGQIPPDEPPQAALCLYASRPQLDRATHTLFPHFDFFVAPPHERSNWAMGLGLPMFIVDPPIGTFAPLNREILLQHAVARALTADSPAGAFGRTLASLRASGMLVEMARAGWGRFEIDGFARIAAFLRERFMRPQHASAKEPQRSRGGVDLHQQPAGS